MHTEDFILAVLASSPDRKIRGKKRLQKLAYFLKVAGAKYDAQFDIRDFGPFSREVARAAQLLAAKGVIEEKEEPIGVSRTFVTIYRLPVVGEGAAAKLGDKYKTILRDLDKFDTIDLEVAATYDFFRSAGLSEDAARKKTVQLKPTKATTPVLRNIERIVGCLSHS